MANFKSILFLILILLIEKSFAYTPEEGKVTATFGPYINKTNFEKANTGITAPFIGGFALVVVGDISARGSLEIATIYTPQIFIRELEGKYLSERSQTVHITMGYRRWLSSYLSASLAFYSAYTIGDPEVLYRDAGASSELDTSARDTTEYGFDLATQGELWSHDKWAVILEGRYSRSVTSKVNEHSDQYGVLLGLRYMAQEEKKVETKAP